MLIEYTYHEIIEEIKKVVPPSVKVYLVGGAVRDILLARPVKDFDIVIEEFVRPVGKKLANALGGKYYVLDETRDMARVILDQSTEQIYCIDIAHLTGESIEDDLSARDFTVNAIAIDFMERNAFVDPLGGMTDLKEKRLRMCSPTSLEDDPMRAVRSVRMALEYELTMDSELISALKRIAPSLSRCSMERYRDEFFKILFVLKTPTAIQILDQYQILPYLIPLGDKNDLCFLLEITRTMDHLFAILTQDFNEPLSSNYLSGLAVLKLGEFREELKAFFDQSISQLHSHRALMQFGLIAKYYHCGADAMCSKNLVQRAKHLLLSVAEVTSVVKASASFDLLLSNPVKTDPVSIHRYYRKFGQAGVDGILLCLARILIDRELLTDATPWTNALDWTSIYLDSWFRHYHEIVSPAPLIGGKEMQEQLGVPAGPEIGRLKEMLIESQISGAIQTEAEALVFLKKALSVTE